MLLHEKLCNRNYQILIRIIITHNHIRYEQFIYSYTQQELSPLLNGSSPNLLINYLRSSTNPIRDMSSLATTLYWFGFCLFRFVAIVQAQFMSARTMLVLNLIGCLTGTAILLLSANITLSMLSIFIF